MNFHYYQNRLTSIEYKWQLICESFASMMMMHWMPRSKLVEWQQQTNGGNDVVFQMGWKIEVPSVVLSDTIELVKRESKKNGWSHKNEWTNDVNQTQTIGLWRIGQVKKRMNERKSKIDDTTDIAIRSLVIHLHVSLCVCLTLICGIRPIPSESNKKSLSQCLHVSPFNQVCL